MKKAEENWIGNQCTEMETCLDTCTGGNSRPRFFRVFSLDLNRVFYNIAAKETHSNKCRSWSHTGPIQVPTGPIHFFILHLHISPHGFQPVTVGSSYRVYEILIMIHHHLMIIRVFILFHFFSI